MSKGKTRMRTRLLRKLLAVQSFSGQEDDMVRFLVNHCRREGYIVQVDAAKNVYVTKGVAAHYPTVAAHIDTVHRPREVQISYTLDERGEIATLIGYRKGTDVQCGIGADCKTGVFVCLELLRELPAMKAVFFAMEEVGCQGARRSDPMWFLDVGYLIEFDCPSKNMMSYTSSGIRLFDNHGEFIQTALPVLQKYGVKWQHHPYTDVSVIRPMHGMSCLNLASGYYNWHGDDEFVYVPDVKNAIVMAKELLAALGEHYFPFMNEDSEETLVPVTRLMVERPPGV